MGRHWYETEGKYLKKRNTFTDFCDCAEFLINRGYTRARELAISGRSAGGLLMGAVINMRPDLFKVCRPKPLIKPYILHPISVPT